MGSVYNVKDNIITCSNAASKEQLFVGSVVKIFDNKNIQIGEGTVFELSATLAKILLISGENIKTESLVYGDIDTLYVNTGLSVLGKVINPLGQTLLSFKTNGFQNSFYSKNYKRLSISGSPDIIERKTVCKPLHTGVLSVDTLIPVGLGQRQLIIGDKNVGKTSLAITVIKNQKSINAKLKNNFFSANDKNKFNTFVPCIYVSIGQKRSEILRLRHFLINSDSFWYTTMVFTSADDYPVLQYYAPYTGCSLGESFMDRGFDSVLVFDDLTKHSVAYRQISLLLRRPPGREAFPGDVFFLHSKLLERAAQLGNAEGEGSMTALPIIETFSGDVSGYIPTNVISITDGQIFLSTNLFNKGIIPAVDLTLSVSRVGSASQTNVMKGLSKHIKLILSYYRQYDTSAGMSVSETSTSKLYLTKGKLLNYLFTQPLYSTLCYVKQVIYLYTVVGGWVDNLDLEECIFYLNTLLDNNFVGSLGENKISDELTSFLSNLHYYEDSFRSMSYDSFVSFIEELYKGYNLLYKKEILGVKLSLTHLNF